MKILSLVWIIGLSICILGMSGVIAAQQGSVIVPNVQGIALEVAAQMLQTAGLQPKYQNLESPTALVVQQEPGPGFELPLGGEVSLSCWATGKTSKMMPAIQSQPRTLAITSQPRTSVAPAKVSGMSVKNMPTGISVVPIQTTSTSSRNVVSSGRISAGQPTILYQPRQPAASKYMIAESQSRFYPVWYPRRFITNATTPSKVSQPRSVKVITTVQPSVSFYTVPETESKASLAWYPRPLLSQQERTQSSITRSVETQPISVTYTGSVETQPISVTYSYPLSDQQRVPMPYLLRLNYEDAIWAIQKAGLSVGHIWLISSDRERTGLVLKQSPQFRAIVPVGTQVDLWITN